MARLRPRTKQFILAGAIGAAAVLLISVVVLYFGYEHMNREQKEERLRFQQELTEARKLLKEQENSHQTVWVLRSDIEAGHMITAEDLISAELLTTLVPANALNKDEAIGKVTKLPLTINTLLVEPMLFENGETPQDLRNQEFSLMKLPLLLNVGDFVDVRINFPGGQDYIVLSKKKVEHLLNGTIWYELNEEEILMMSSAIVDAYINNASIYALSYVDPYMQKEAVVNYPPNEIVIDLMKLDPNIVKRATNEMEKRQRQRLEKELEAIDPATLEKYKSGLSSAQNATSEAESTSGDGQSESSGQSTVTDEEAVQQDPELSQPTNDAASSTSNTVNPPSTSLDESSSQTDQSDVFSQDPNQSIQVEQ